VLTGATARRYAEAVFEIAQESGTIERWHQDILTIGEYFGDRHLVFILKEPKISFQKKSQIVRDLLATKVQPEAINLALLLVERDLAELGPRISESFTSLYNDYKGQAVADVTTAIPLDDTLRAEVTRQLEEWTGKHILLREHVDPSILGGAVARVGDMLIDGSLKRRFAQLRQHIATSGGSFGGPLDGTAPVSTGPDAGGTNGNAPSGERPS